VAVLAAGAVMAAAAGLIALRPWRPALPSVTAIGRAVAAQETGVALRLAAARLARRPADPPLLDVLDAMSAALIDGGDRESLPPGDAGAARGIALSLHAGRGHGSDGAQVAELAGRFALLAGNDEMAAADLMQAEARGAPPARLAAPRALAALHVGQFAAAVQVAQPDPDMPAAKRAMLLILRARGQLGLSQVAAARASLTAALAADPDAVEALARLGLLALWQDHDPAAAADLLARARRLAPEAVPTLRLAGEYAYATGDFAGSAATYGTLARRRVAETFDPVPASLGAARALIYAGDLAGARAALDAAPLPADDPSLRYDRALLAYRSGDFTDAVEQARALDFVWPDYPPLDLLEGGALLAAGYPASAAARLGHYMGRQPDNDAGRRLLDAAQRGGGASRQDLLAALGFPLDATGGLTDKGGL
jgi:hypothetical protein